MNSIFQNIYFKIIFKVAKAILIALATFYLRLTVYGGADSQAIYLFFLTGVVVSALIDGFFSGLITTFLSLVLISYYFISPQNSLLIQGYKDLVAACIFVFVSILISFFAERMRQAIFKSISQTRQINEMKSDLLESSTRVEILMDSISDAFINIDSENRIIYLNHAAEELFKRTKEELVNLNFWTLFPNAKKSGLYYKINNIVDANESNSFEHFSPDTNKWLEIHVFPTLENNGIALYMRDISNFKKREARMLKNESYYKRFVNSNVVGIIIANLEGDILDVNEAFLNTIGYNKEDFKKGLVKWTEITPPEYQKIDQEHGIVLRTKGVTDTYEKNYLRKDGSLVPTLVARILIDPEQGVCLSYVVDISERKHNEERLKESEQRFRNMADSAPGMIWMTNPEKLAHYFNKRWLEFRGRTFEEEYGYGWIEGIHPDDKEKSLKIYEQAFNNKKDFEMEYRLKRADGEYRWVLDKGLPRFTPGGRFKGYIGMAIDITERKEAQAQLKESRDQLRIIFQNVADAITVQDREGKTIYINDRSAELIGFQSVDELKKLNPKKLQTEILETYEVRDENNKIIQQEELPGRRVLNGEKEVDMVFNLFNKVNKHGRWYRMKSRAVLDDSKKLRFAVNILSDITDVKEREKLKDEFMSIASHELKTPITTIKAFTQILIARTKKEDDEQRLNYLLKMDNQVNNLTNLVSDLLDVSRIQAGKLSLEKEAFNLNKLLNDTINNLQMTYPSHKLIKINEVECEISADKRRIEQVLINLINNAVKYSPNSNKVEIEIKKEENYVEVCVKDYGIGINKKDQKKIFERFYISEENRENRFFGLGLGLFISSEIIRRHKGLIYVESEKGKGSTFYIKLPLIKK